MSWPPFQAESECSIHSDQARPPVGVGRDIAHCPRFFLGVAWWDGVLVDQGAGQCKFKTPTLREVARTALHALRQFQESSFGLVA